MNQCYKVIGFIKKVPSYLPQDVSNNDLLKIELEYFI